MKKNLILTLSLVLSPALYAQTFTYTGGPDDIPDNDLLNPLCTTVDVTGGATVSSTNLVSIEFAATHTWIGDLDITLDSPDAASPTPIFLRDRLGINGDGGLGDSSNLDAGNPIFFFDTAATPVADLGVGCTDSDDIVGSTFDCPEVEMMPSNPLSTFNGEAAVGTWTLCVGDGAGQDTGTLTSWSIIGDGNLPVELQSFSID